MSYVQKSQLFYALPQNCTNFSPFHKRFKIVLIIEIYPNIRQKIDTATIKALVWIKYEKVTSKYLGFLSEQFFYFNDSCWFGGIKKHMGEYKIVERKLWHWKCVMWRPAGGQDMRAHELACGVALDARGIMSATTTTQHKGNKIKYEPSLKSTFFLFFFYLTNRSYAPLYSRYTCPPQDQVLRDIKGLHFSGIEPETS